MSTNITVSENKDVSARLLKIAIAFLDSKGIVVQIVKIKRVKQYDLYVNFAVYGKSRKSRQSLKRRIWKIYETIQNDKTVENPAMECPQKGITKKHCIYPFCRCLPQHFESLERHQ